MAKKELVAVVKGEISDFQKKMAEVSATTQKVGQKMKDIGKTMSTYVTLPILAAGGASIKFASDYVESINKVDAAFKTSANEVKKFAKTTLANFGIAEGSALDMAALFGDMATSMGFVPQEAAKLSISLVGLAGDLASFKNIGIDQAMTALNGIFTGETESLKMLGIVMTEANLEAFALSQGIRENVKDMTQAEKVALRYAYVMDQTKNAQGDAAKTGHEAAGQMRRFGESMKQLGQQFGAIILPLFTKVLTKVNEWILKFSELDERTKKIIIVVAGVAAAIGPLLVILGTLVTTVIPALVVGFTTLLPLIGPISLAVFVAYQAFKFFNDEAKKTKAIIDGYSKMTMEELNSSMEELNKQMQVSLTLANTNDKVQRKAHLDRVAEIGEKIEGIKNEIKAREEAEKAQIEMSEAAKQANEDAAKALAEEERKRLAQLGLIGQIEEKISKLNDSFKLASTGGDVRKIVDELRLLNEELDSIYLAARPIEETLAPLKDIKTATLEVAKVTREELGQAFEDAIARGKAAIQTMKYALVDITDLVAGALMDSFNFLGEAIGDAISGKGFNGSKLLDMVATWAQQLGAILVSAGLAFFAFQTQFAANPLAVVAAGGILIAAASAVKAIVANRPGGESAGGGYSSAGGGDSSFEGFRNLREFNISLSGEFVQKGSDLVAVIGQENTRRNY
jgi:hypothetical protein